ncbi:LysE family translocator [Lacibacter sp.]|uniref:LysE family translocator n=1 Tax=Lacibacter sp. TaxID=1915409 RepID=UPI002B4B6162|nr:LysE family transporter [Lacibacter sp.]HLP38436.1 LysE family transporter [Lacibacter sp.]
MTEAIIKGLALGLLLAISMGPVIFSIIKQSISNGHKGGLAFVFGVSASDLTLVLVSNIFTELFNRLLKFEKVIGLGGSALLIGIGVYFLFFKKIKLNELGDGIEMKRSAGDYVKIFFAGYFMNTLNPSVIAFWFTWATAFVTIPVNERIATFAVCLSVVFIFDLLKVFLANKLRSRLTQKTITLINKISGSILIVFGIILIIGLLFYRK